jgi:hypothetical protein
VKVTGLLAFMVGATRTVSGPDVAPVGIVAVTDVALQAVTGATSPFSITALLPCGAPNPDPEITTEVPTGPPVADSAVIAGVGALGVLTDTLSNVAVARAELLELFTANPIYTFCAILIVTLVPICAQFTPSAEVYPLNVLPLRTNFTQYGSVTLADVLADVLLPPVLTRSSKYIRALFPKAA